MVQGLHLAAKPECRTPCSSIPGWCAAISRMDHTPVQSPSTMDRSLAPPATSFFQNPSAQMELWTSPSGPPMWNLAAPFGKNKTHHEKVVKNCPPPKVLGEVLLQTFVGLRGPSSTPVPPVPSEKPPSAGWLCFQPLWPWREVSPFASGLTRPVYQNDPKCDCRCSTVLFPSWFCILNAGHPLTVCLSLPPPTPLSLSLPADS